MNRPVSGRMVALCCAIGYLSSCAPSRFVKPLEKREQAVNVAVGGAVIGYNKLALPMPFLSVTYGYGLDSGLTVFGALNLTAAFYGNAQAEAGVVKRLVKQNRGWPGVSVTPVANFIYRNKDAAKLYPQVDLNGYWDYNRGKNLFYAGFSNWFELAAKKDYDIKQDNHWLFSPMVGEQFIHKKWTLSLELKMVAANLSSRKTVVDYKTPFAHNGAMGIYIGYTKKFK